MDHAVKPSRRRFLVVTRHVIVAEDLREALGCTRGNIIDVNREFQEQWTGPYDAAFFSVPLEDLLRDERVIDLRRQGTQIVSIDGDVPDSEYEGTGIIPLSQPFSSLDVDRVIIQMGLKSII